MFLDKEKAQWNKQQKKENVKRGDKRNRTMSNNDSFIPRASRAVINSAAGGNNILGYYGLKSDNQDVTTHVAEVPFHELLDGSYKPPYLGKDKETRAENMNGNFLHSVQNAFSVLEPRKNVKSRTDRRRKRLSSASCLAKRIAREKKDTDKTIDVSVLNKDLSNKHECFPNVPEFSLLQPEEVLERLKLPPNDLDSLLLEGSKPKIKKSSGKPTTDQAVLPPFSCSHYSTGNFKTIIDATTLASKRTSSQRKWARVENIAGVLGVASDRFTDLESLTYDSSLVPLREPVEETGENFMEEFNADEDSSRQLVAAQTLLDLAEHSSRLNLYAKTIELHELLYNRLVQLTNQYESSKKKPKLSMPKKTNNLARVHADIKTPISWPTPKSYGLFTSRSIKDSNAEAKHDKANIVKESFMLPPSAIFSEVYTAIDDPDCRRCSICPC